MLTRLLIVLVLSIVGIVVYRLWTQRQLEQVAAQRNTDPILQNLMPGIHAIVYFTTPMCMPCKTQQQPVLQRLQLEFGEMLQVVQIDATQDPDAADRWGVMSAPTTFVLNPEGYPKAVNHGVADENKLKQQLINAA